MKNAIVLSIVLLLTTLQLKGQETYQALKDNLANELCTCLDEQQDKAENGKELLETCGEIAMQQVEVELMEAMAEKMGLDAAEFTEEEGYQKGYEFGATLMQKVMVDMVDDCDIFYQLIDKNRQAGKNDLITLFKELYTDNDEEIIKNYLDEDDTNPEKIFAIGMYFYANGKPELAEKNFQSLLAIEEHFETASVLLSYLYEDAGRYDEAILLYEKLYDNTNNHLNLIIIEVLKRNASTAKE